MQETIEITTPLTKKKVVIRGYQPARLRQAVQSIILRGQEFGAGQDVEALQKELKVSGEKLEEITNTTLKHMVLSVDGAMGDVLELVLDMPEEDFDYIVAEVEKVKGPLVKPS